MNSGHSVWAITPEERDKHDKQFDSLSPTLGFVSGDQARKFFIQSGLPSPVLAEIWTLADMNKDGKMDRLEFSIAMKLIKIKLQGQNLPLSLPIIMKQPPVPVPSPMAASSARFGMGSMPNLAMMPTVPVLATMPMTPSITSMVSVGPLMPTGLPMPLLPSLSTPTLPNGPPAILQPTPVAMTSTLPLSNSFSSSPLGFGGVGMTKTQSLLDLGSSSSNSSSTTSLASNSPKTGSVDWDVPSSSRLKYRQIFNGLDKQMTGYLSGAQVKNALASTYLTQTQLATIWNLADVDKDGQLKADEFILAMHLVDMAKTGQPLPLSLPADLVPPSHRGGKSGDAVNGNVPPLFTGITEEVEPEPPQKLRANVTFEDKLKENFQRGNAELEKRRLALQEQQRREEEQRQKKAREEQERREREAHEQEMKRKAEEERRLERQRELERQKEEERLKELERKEAAKQELERQRRLEWERRKRQELLKQKSQEQEEITQLKIKKKSLELELEAVGDKHKQISDQLHDAQSKRGVQKSQLDQVNQKRDVCILEVNSLQKQLEDSQKKLSQLLPEQQMLTERMRNLSLNNLPSTSRNSVKKSTSEKELTCRKLKEQLDALEKETSTKLTEMDQCHKDVKELRESQSRQQATLDKLYKVKQEKLKEIHIRREEELERKRKEEEEAARKAKLEKERQWREKLKKDEEERQRRLQEEREAKQKEEEAREAQARLQAALEQAERDRRLAEEEERRRKEEEKRRQEEERRKEEERKAELRRKQEERRLEEERQREERRRTEEERKRLEEERRKLEEERKRLQEERREEEKRREREEEERRKQRAQEAAIRDAEERKRQEEEEKRRQEERKKREDERKRQEEEKRRRQEEQKRKQEEEKRRQLEEERRKQEEERMRQEEEKKKKEEASKKKQLAEEAARQQKLQLQPQQQNGAKAEIHGKLSAALNRLGERKAGLRPITSAHRKSAALTTYRALYPFVARNGDELTFEANDLIEVDEMTEGEPGWLYGSREGKMGWFPASYVEQHLRQETSPTAVNAQESQTVPSAGSSSTLQTEGISPHAGRSPPSPAGQRSAFTSTHAPTSTGHEQGLGNVWAQALCSWTAKTDSHLNFSKDDIITVLEQQENWWLGELNGVQGWFPKTYVKLMTGSNPSTEQVYSNVDGLDGAATVQQEEYVALYTYNSPEPGDLTFNEGDSILVTERQGEWWKGKIGERSGLFPSNYVKPKETDASHSAGKAETLNKKPEIAQVTAPYTAADSEQLSLTPGQVILILAKNPTGWWQGELQARGKKRQNGWFPASHVKLLGANSGKSTPALVPLCQVIAMYDYKAANEDEMSFSKGQLINVLEKDDADWWKGELNGVTGLFPTNYIKMTTECDPSQQWCADLLSLDTMSPIERKRQGYIHELIETEERYMEDLQLVLEVFHRPMAESGRLTEVELNMIFVNWKELITSNTKLLKALRVRKKTSGERMPVQMIGDILASELSHMQAYIRFCSCQLNGAALLQLKTDQEPEFKDFLKKIATDHRCKGMPLSSFLLKPMQRITRYPLLIKNILECTMESHIDNGQLKEALERAEELCLQVNEGVREKENSDRLEWIQAHVQCDGVIEHLIFNSLTNCLGPRKLLHSGKLYKTKSNKELYAFLFSDFLLFTQSVKQFSSSGGDKLFSPKSNTQFKMYKTPVFLNEVLVKMPADPSSDEPVFHISHIDRVYTLKTENIHERTAWVQKVKTASEHFIDTEKKKREKAYQARSMKTSGIGRLLVTILEAMELKSSKPNGKSNPYCEVTMGAQCYTSRTLNDTVNPKWNFNCQFSIKDLYQDVLCITLYERDQFSPDDFLGRTEVPVATIKKELENKGAASRRLLLHEVPTGEVWVRLDLQLFEQKTHK